MSTNRADRHRKFRGSIVTTSATYPEIVNGYLKERFGPLKNAAKILGRVAGVTPRTAENWLADECAPRGEQLLTLMAECKELADRIMAAAEERRRCSQ